MNIREAGKKAKRLYGPKAFVRIANNGLRDILLDNIPVPGITGTLLGWGHTWEEAFRLARIRTRKGKQKKRKR